MNVYQKRKQIAEVLHRDLGTGFIVVSNPDHPLLVEGPDTLVGGEAGLVAFFIPKTKELAQPHLLQVRYTLSRLALPPDTRHVLLLDTTAQGGSAHGLDRNFTAVVEWNALRNLGRIVKDRSSSADKPKVPPEIGLFVRNRFLATLQTTSTLRSINLRERTKVGQAADRGGGRQEVNFGFLEPGLLLARIGEQTSDGTVVRKLADKTTLAGFSLDNGVPYPTRNDDYGIAIVDHLPDNRGDPDKLIRAAAFAGWTLVPKEQESRINAVANRLKSRRISDQNQ